MKRYKIRYNLIVDGGGREIFTCCYRTKFGAKLHRRWVLFFYWGGDADIVGLE